MSYFVSHTHYSTPINIWITRQQFPMSLFVKSFNSFS